MRVALFLIEIKCSEVSLFMLEIRFTYVKNYLKIFLIKLHSNCLYFIYKYLKYKLVLYFNCGRMWKICASICECNVIENVI